MIYHVPPVVLGLFYGVGAMMCFHGGRRNVMNHAPTAGTLVFRARRNVINHTPSAGALRLFYAMLIQN